MAGYGRNCPGGRPPATPTVLPPAPSPGRKAAHHPLRPPLPSFLGPGGGSTQERARELCELAGSPTWRGPGTPGASFMALLGWGETGSYRRAVCPCGCCFSELCAENAGLLRAHVWPRISERPLRSPLQPLWGGLRMLGLRHHVVPSLSSGCWALPWVPGTAGRSWVMGVSGSELPQAEAQGGCRARGHSCRTAPVHPRSRPVGPPSRQGGGGQRGGRPARARAVPSA